jgi:hypothetical protein
MLRTSSLHAVTLLALVACSPAVVPADAGTAAPDTGPDAVLDSGAVSIATACRDQSFARCSWLETCSTTELQRVYGSFPACKAIQSAICLNNLMAPSTAATPATSEACATALQDRHWPCTDFIDNANPPPECQVQPGPFADGAPCGVSSQCHSTYCGLPLGRACGTCMPPPDAGASCAELTCPQGLICLSPTMQCVTAAFSGQTCSASQPCASNLACLGGTCTPTAQSGPCDPQGAGCDFTLGLACNAASNTCQPARLAGPGEGCGEVDDQPTVCATGTCVRGACVANFGLGGACETNGTPCGSALRCIVSSPADGGTTGTCQAQGSSSCP